MKNIVALFVFFLLFITEASAQPFWVQTNGPGESRTLEINFDSSGGTYVMTGWYGHFDRLFRSSDNGSTWSKLPLSKKLCFNLRTLPNGHLLMQIDSAICLSTNLGQSWTPILAVPVPHDSTFHPEDGSISSAAPTAPFVVTISGGIFAFARSKILRSWNEGTTWDSVPAPTAAGSLAAFYSPLLFFSTPGRGLFRSTDSGKSWGKVINGLGDDPIVKLGSNPQGILWCETFSGSEGADFFQMSTDDGRTWKVKMHFDATNVRFTVLKDGSFAIPYWAFQIQDTSGHITQEIAGPDIWQNCRLMETSPTGQIWIEGPFHGGPDSTSPAVYSALPAGEVSDLVCVGGDTLFTHSYYSSDGGVTWLTSNRIRNSTKTYVTAPNRYLYFGNASGVFRSTDNGSSWDNLNKGLRSLSVACMAVDSANNIFAATDEGLYVSHDNALDWTRSDFQIPSGSLVSVMTVNLNGDVLALLKNSGIYWTTDTGFTWSIIGTGLSGFVNCMMSAPSGHVFAGTTNGIFYIENGGASWRNVSDGLTNLNVLCITRDSYGTVYLGTNGDGVFHSTQKYNRVTPASIESHSKRTDDLSILSICPNPAHEFCRVGYFVPNNTFIRIDLKNALGQSVIAMHSLSVISGVTQTELELSKLPNGIYFLILESDHSRTESRVVITH